VPPGPEPRYGVHFLSSGPGITPLLSPLAPTLGVMIAVLFDSNIYDRLAEDLATRSRVRALVLSGSMRVLVSRTVAEELSKSPFQGTPTFFPTEYVGNTVGNVHMAVSDSIGSGIVFKAHRGTSKKTGDAYVVDAASCYANWLVSEDGRLRRRSVAAGSKAQSIGYDEFCNRLAELERIPTEVAFRLPSDDA
jgi:hypothetical protein